MKEYILIIPLLSLSYRPVFTNLQSRSAYIGVNKISEFTNTDVKVGCLWINTLKRFNKKPITPKAVDLSTYDKLYNSPYSVYVVKKIDDIPDTGELLLVPLSIFDYDYSDFDIIADLKLTNDYVRGLLPSEWGLLPPNSHKRKFGGGSTIYYILKDNVLQSVFCSILIKRRE